MFADGAGGLGVGVGVGVIGAGVGDIGAGVGVIGAGVGDIGVIGPGFGVGAAAALSCPLQALSKKIMNKFGINIFIKFLSFILYS